MKPNQNPPDAKEVAGSTTSVQTESKPKKGCTWRLPLAGVTVAVCVSWIFNHSVLWAIFHGILNWFYVAYKTIWYVVKHY